MKTFKWTEQQKKALRGSIRKWQKIADMTGIDEGPDNCPCCKIWWKDKDCEGCPISQFTCSTECMDTPYTQWMNTIQQDQDGNRKATFRSQQEMALSELNFIKAVYLAGGGK